MVDELEGGGILELLNYLEGKHLMQPVVVMGYIKFLLKAIIRRWNELSKGPVELCAQVMLGIIE